MEYFKAPIRGPKVSGLLVNGDLAEWGELDWLMDSISGARAALNPEKEE